MLNWVAGSTLPNTKQVISMASMTVREFISKWRLVSLKERSGAQEHFIDLCRLVGHPTPAEADPAGEWFTFEAGAGKTKGGQGWADVWKREFFAWEYKGNHKDLDAAYSQLLQYRESLENPPLLVVSDMQNFRIHTNWTNTVKREYEFSLEDLEQPSIFRMLEAVFHDPDHLHPREQADKMTEVAAGRFAALADELRKAGHAPKDVAHFLTQVVFCLFAEDIRLLSRGPKGEAGIFTEILMESRQEKRNRFPRYTQDLFRSMASGGSVLFQDIAHFNGGLFNGDAFFVPELRTGQIDQLLEAARLDWSAIEPSIFGTLFERGLDPAKRSQIGAHYTSRKDIEAIVEPVLMAPLRREWEAVQAGQGTRDGFLSRLGSVRVLDPACGSGNFLYVSLGLLKDLEKEVIQHPAFDGLPPVEPRFVTPAQLYGIEISDYAHELASVVVWIGYIQWFRNNGYRYEQKPILQKLGNVACQDAILGVGEDGALTKPEWPEAEVIVGNPPFLGGKKMRAELGDEYVDALFERYQDEVPREADLVTYWFERARQQIEAGKARRAGLLATQGIRGGANRGVLERIKQTGDIFFAYSDREWIQEGVAVHVSMIGFDDRTEQVRFIDGVQVLDVNIDLTSGTDLTRAKKLPENRNIAFMGITRGGPFDLPPEVAQRMLAAPLNPNERPNSDVVRPWVNASDISGRSRNYWIVDFGVDMPKEEAALYEAPFEYIKEHVKPVRRKSRTTRTEWWLHERPRPEMRKALSGLARFLVTPLVSKHRIFAWLTSSIVPENLLYVFARDDDYFFGVLHSRPHELWSLRQGTQLREKESGNRYTPTTTFDTFPFPWPPGQEPADDPRCEAIAEAARELNEKREVWLNPPNAEAATLKTRTLTNLYNARPTWLQQAHEKLDRAVFAAYGWDYDEVSGDEEEMLRRLLALNQARGAAS